MSSDNPAREADGQTDREAPEDLVDVLFDLGSPFFSNNNDEMGNFIGHARERLLDPANRAAVLRALLPEHPDDMSLSDLLCDALARAEAAEQKLEQAQTRHEGILEGCARLRKQLAAAERELSRIVQWHWDDGGHCDECGHRYPCQTVRFAALADEEDDR